MYTCEQAVQAAIDYLIRGLHQRLDAKEGWPEGMYVRSRYAGHPVSCESERPERVWHVFVPGEPHVGSSRCLVISQESGEVIADGSAGE